MINTYNKINFNNIITKCILIICLIYPPFVFFSFINELFRLTAFALLLIVLFLKLLFQKIKIKTLLLHGFLLSLLFIYCFSTIYINNNNEGFRSSLGYSLILILSFLVYLNINSNFIFFEFIKKNYVSLFYLITICTIFNFVLNIFLTSNNFLTPYILSDSSYNYSASIFGLSINKFIYNINISRNFWFFIEPVYTAPFFLINIFVISPLIQKSKYFLILNTISGILTFSFLFFIGYLILFLLKNKPYILIFLFTIILIILIYSNFDYEENSIITSSSTSDRLLRIDMAFNILSKFSISQIFFGNGYLFSLSLERGISAGILSSFVEGGLIGMIIPLLLALFYIKYNKILFCIFLLSLITMESYKMPFLWITFILAGKLISIKGDVQ